MKKLIIACAFIIGASLNTLAVYAQSASVDFASGADMSQIHAAVGDIVTEPSETAVNGVNVWHIGSTVWSDENLYLDINDELADSFGKQDDIYLDVVYYEDSSSRDSSFFEVRYRTPDGAESRSETVMSNGTGKFVTERIKLSQAVLDNSMGGSDLVLTTRSWKYGYAQSGVKLKSITVTDSGETAPVRGSITTDNLGNIFFDDDDNCAFKVSLTNFDDKDQSARCVLSVKDEDKIISTHERTISVPPGASISYYVDYESRRYGAYTAELEVFSGSGSYTSECGFSFCRAADNSKNEKMGVCVHLSEAEREPERSMLLASKAGFGSVRDEIRWADYEKTAGRYELTASHKKMLLEARNNGMKILVVLGFGNTLYSDFENTIPTSDEELAAFYRYVYALVTELEEDFGDVVEAYELWNEPNNQTFNEGMKASGADYAHLAETARRAMDDAGSKRTLIGLAMTGIHDPEYVDWCRDAYAAGLGDYIDASSMHPYYLTMSPESFDLTARMDILRDIAEEYGANREVWITEHGWATVRSIPERTQAMYLVRSAALALSDQEFGKYYVYQLQDGGNMPNEREHQYGLVRKWCDTEVPYEAKKAYSALCCFNAITSGRKHVATETVGECIRYRFENDTGEKLHIVFNQDDIPIEYIPAQIPKNMTMTVYDMYGNEIDAGEGISVDGEPIYITYNWQEDYESLTAVQSDDGGNITVYSGCAEGETAEVIVFRNGTSLEDVKRSPENNVLYFNTVKISDRYFSDTFRINGFSGIASITVHYPDTDQYEYAELELWAPQSYELSAGVLTCMVNIDKPYDAYLAEYRNGVLTKVVKYTDEYKTELDEKTDKAVMYLWEMGTMEPICGSLVINNTEGSEAAISVIKQMQAAAGEESSIRDMQTLTWSYAYQKQERRYDQ